MHVFLQGLSVKTYHKVWHGKHSLLIHTPIDVGARAGVCVCVWGGGGG